jgi:hypothetical protein
MRHFVIKGEARTAVFTFLRERINCEWKFICAVFGFSGLKLHNVKTKHPQNKLSIKKHKIVFFS